MRETLASRPPGAMSPQAARASAKAAEAYAGPRQVVLSPTDSESLEYTSLAGSAGAGTEIVIQHRDGGGAPVVRELPPPYADRTQALR